MQSTVLANNSDVVIAQDVRFDNEAVVGGRKAIKDHFDEIHVVRIDRSWTWDEFKKEFELPPFEYWPDERAMGEERMSVEDILKGLEWFDYPHDMTKFTHESETALDRWGFEYVINNDEGLDEYIRKLNLFLNKIFI